MRLFKPRRSGGKPPFPPGDFDHVFTTWLERFSNLVLMLNFNKLRVGKAGLLPLFKSDYDSALH
jgi:hypothetical protein